MVKVYYDLIKANLRTIDQVPIKWKGNVQALLDTDVDTAEASTL